jgi:hypothetical protein
MNNIIIIYITKYIENRSTVTNRLVSKIASIKGFEITISCEYLKKANNDNALNNNVNEK